MGGRGLNPGVGGSCGVGDGPEVLLYLVPPAGGPRLLLWRQAQGPYGELPDGPPAPIGLPCPLGEGGSGGIRNSVGGRGVQISYDTFGKILILNTRVVGN